MVDYIFDANCFIQAHRQSYPIDVAHSYWKKIKELAGSNTIASIDRVYDELFENEDALTQWISGNLPNSFFIDTSDDEILSNYREVVAWANSQDQYVAQAINDFLEYENADAWLVSYGKAMDSTIITYEVSAPESKANIKLPDACNQFGVSCLNPIEMLRALDESF